jgi:hypothetical protein
MIVKQFLPGSPASSPSTNARARRRGSTLAGCRSSAGRDEGHPGGRAHRDREPEVPVCRYFLGPAGKFRAAVQSHLAEGLSEVPPQSRRL